MVISRRKTSCARSELASSSDGSEDRLLRYFDSRSELFFRTREKMAFHMVSASPDAIIVFHFAWGICVSVFCLFRSAQEPWMPLHHLQAVFNPQSLLLGLEARLRLSLSVSAAIPGVLGDGGWARLE